MKFVVLKPQKKRRYIYIKALRLFRENKVTLQHITQNAYYFKVTNRREYDVMISKNKLAKDWCTCMWFSLKCTECSHILAAKIYLDNYTRLVPKLEAKLSKRA